MNELTPEDASPQPEKKLVVVEDLTEQPIERLLNKLEAWLRMQPEWAILFLADRKLRRQASREIAHRLATLPKRGDNERRV